MKLLCSLFVLLLGQAAVFGAKWQEVQIGPDSHLSYRMSVKEVTITPDPDEIRRLKSAIKTPGVIIGAPANPLRIAVFQVYLKRGDDEVVVGSVEMPEICVIDASIGLAFELMDAKIEGNTLHYLYRDRWHCTLVTVELQENRVRNTTKLYVDYGFWEKGSLETKDGNVYITLGSEASKRWLRTESGFLATLEPYRFGSSAAVRTPPSHKWSFHMPAIVTRWR